MKRKNAGLTNEAQPKRRHLYQGCPGRSTASRTGERQRRALVEMAERYLRASVGFTLVEVLIALLLTALVLVPAMSAMANLLGNTVKRDVKAQALDLARSTIEALKDLGADAFSKGTSVTTVTSFDGNGSFDIERVMQIYDEDSGSRLWEVTVSVYEHPMSDSATPLCSLTTLIYPE